MIAVAERTEDLLFHGALAAQRGVTSGIERMQGTLQRKYAESKVAWFAIVLAVVIFLSLALFAYLTVECWNRGYSGFSGLVNWQYTNWTHIYLQVNFGCF
jgi:hypothetical protein